MPLRPSSLSHGKPKDIHANRAKIADHIIVYQARRPAFKQNLGIDFARWMGNNSQIWILATPLPPSCSMGNNSGLPGAFATQLDGSVLVETYSQRRLRRKGSKVSRIGRSVRAAKARSWASFSTSISGPGTALLHRKQCFWSADAWRATANYATGEVPISHKQRVFT